MVEAIEEDIDWSVGDAGGLLTSTVRDDTGIVGECEARWRCSRSPFWLFIATTDDEKEEEASLAPPFDDDAASEVDNIVIVWGEWIELNESWICVIDLCYMQANM